MAGSHAHLCATLLVPQVHISAIVDNMIPHQKGIARHIRTSSSHENGSPAHMYPLAGLTQIRFSSLHYGSHLSAHKKLESIWAKNHVKGGAVPMSSQLPFTQWEQIPFFGGRYLVGVEFVGLAPFFCHSPCWICSCAVHTLVLQLNWTRAMCVGGAHLPHSEAIPRRIFQREAGIP